MNSIEWLLSELEKVNYHPTEAMIMYAKKLHKQEIIDAYFGGLNGSINDYSESKQVGSEIIDIKYGKGAEQYYQETFVSKGSDEILKDYHIVDTNKMIELPKHPSVISENGNELLFDKEGNLIKEVVEDDAAPIDWLINQLENHIVLSAHNKLGTNRTGDYRIGLRKAIDFCHQAKEMEAKETLYTEEQLIGFSKWADDCGYMYNGGDNCWYTQDGYKRTDEEMIYFYKNYLKSTL